jgi:hypothetical protein
MVREFRGLVGEMERRLDEVLEPLRASLMKMLAGVDTNQLRAAAGPEIQEKWAHEFSTRSKRAPYPTGHTVYWDAVADAPRERIRRVRSGPPSGHMPLSVDEVNAHEQVEVSSQVPWCVMQRT